MAFGALGAIGTAAVGPGIAEHWAQASGRKVVEEHHIADPGINIRNQLLHELSQAYGLRVAPSVAEPTDGATTEWGDADLILQARTTEWAMSFIPTDSSPQFELLYRSRVTLIDNRRHQKIADGTCDNTGATRKEDHLTYEQWLANDAAFLRGQLAVVEARCLARFRSGLLALTDAPVPRQER